jgi:hypothetical protein
VSGFERLTANLKAPEYEGFDENNVTRFHHVLRLGDTEMGGQGDSARRPVAPSPRPKLSRTQGRT